MGDEKKEEEKEKNTLEELFSAKKTKNSDIKLAVLKMDEEVFSADKIYKLISLVPTPEEVTQMLDYEGPDNELAACERFFNQFRNMDNVKERLQIWSYKMAFNED